MHLYSLEVEQYPFSLSDTDTYIEALNLSADIDIHLIFFSLKTTKL